MFTAFFATFEFALSITAPIFLLLILGIVLRRLNWLNENFTNVASYLVFTIGLPTILFINIAQAHLDELVSFKLIGVGLTATLAVFVLLYAVSPLVVKNPSERGIFIQGGFRGNMGIIGLAFCISAYGEEAITIISIYMAMLTILFNILAVFILTKTLSVTEPGAVSKSIIRNIVKNPLIISIFIALIFAAFNIPIHSILLTTGEHISAMTLPLALICIGASMNIKELTSSSSTSVITSALKLIVVPAISLLIALPFDFSPTEMGIIFLMSAAPTATASYIMVQAMRGNGVLAANIVVLSTLLSVVTVSLGIVLLKSFNII